MKPRVLVTGTGQFGVGEGLVSCLQMRNGEYEVFAANAEPTSRSLYSSAGGYLLPSAHEPDYLTALDRAVKDCGADFLIPGSEPELVVLSRERPRIFEQTGCRVLANSPQVVTIGDNKFDTYRFLKQNGIPTPETRNEITEEAANELGWPLILKPANGGGSKHVYVVEGAQALNELRQSLGTSISRFILQQYIGSMEQEFTSSALSMPDHKIIGTFAARRTLAGGATASVVVDEYPEIHELTRKVASALCADGPINVQSRIHQGTAMVFEINPRFSGSAPFRALCGFNEPHLLIQSILLGKPPKELEIRTGVFGIRSFQETIFPLSDMKRVKDYR